MPITITETRGISGNAISAERRFFINGTNSLVDARAALVTWLTDNSGLTFANLPYKDCDLDEDILGAWRARVMYASPSGGGGGGGGGGTLDAIGFDTSGTTRKVTRGLDEKKSSGAPAASNLIGVNQDGTVEGVEAVGKVFNFSRRKSLLPASVTTAYIGALFAATGTVNNDEWSDFLAGEVLYRGVRGQKSYAGPWELEFFFSAVPTPFADSELGRVKITKSGGFIQIDNVKPWDAVWTLNRTIKVTVDTIDIAIPDPWHGYANKVYEASNFDLLNAI